MLRRSEPGLPGTAQSVLGRTADGELVLDEAREREEAALGQRLGNVDQTARAEHAPRLRQSRPHRLDRNVVQRAHEDDEVDRTVGDREVLGAPDEVSAVGVLAPGGRELLLGDLESGDTRPPGRELAGQRTRTAADVEHVQTGRRRKWLEDFGVGGELHGFTRG